MLYECCFNNRVGKTFNPKWIITAQMLTKIAKIDYFNGAWPGGLSALNLEQLNVMKRIATIESIGSSNRI